MVSGGCIRTPDQRVRVFVSSTLGELGAERAAAREAIERLHLIPVMFELGARPHPPRTLYRAYLEQSQIFVGIYWERYGWVAPGEEISGLEDEYRLSEGMPRLLYVKAPAAGRDHELDALLAEVEQEGSASYRRFTDPDELGELLAQDLATFLSERFVEAVDPSETQPQLARSPLPALLTPTLGRGEDVAGVVTLLRGGTRLVTLSGPGGIGKSRIALEVARLVEADYPDGVIFVSLAAIEDPALVPSLVLERVGARAEGAQQTLEAVIERLRDRRALLVLDNLEQVASSAPDLGELLDACHQLQVLVTSRHLLRLRAERDWPVSPLLVPAEGHDDLGEIAASPAVELFVEQARASRPSFALTVGNAGAVAELVRRLDGLPLAIELAAARVRLLDVGVLLDRLGTRLDLLTDGSVDLPERQRTLRATLDWSYQLLDADEQVLLARLSVFAGTCHLDAVEQVCAGPPVDDVLSSLSSLLDKSLLVSTVDDRSGTPRLSLLRTVRVYAHERLDELGEVDRLQRRHIDWVRKLAEDRDPSRCNVDVDGWSCLEVEADNIREALRRSIERADLASAAAMIWPLACWFWLTGRLREGHAIARRIRDGLPPDADALTVARAHGAIGILGLQSGSYEEAAGDIDRAVAAFRVAGDEPGGIAMQVCEVVLAQHAGDTDAAAARARMALEGSRRLDLHWPRAFSANLLGTHVALAADFAGARSHLDESLAAGLEVGIEQIASQSRLLHARLDLLEGAVGRAAAGLAATAREVTRARHLEQAGYALELAAEIAFATGRAEDAARAMGAADLVRERLGCPVWPVLKPHRDAFLAALRAELGEERCAAAMALGAAADPFALLDAAADGAAVPLTAPLPLDT